MDPSFAFPRPQAAIPRPQPLKSAGSTVRESNALRASVLDAALELGIGNNSLVADWMFNNAVVEEDEAEYPISSPSLTYGSSATSEESSSSALTPSSSISSSKYSGAGAIYGSNSKPAFKTGGMVQINEAEADVPSFNNTFTNNTVAFPDVPIPPRPITPVSKKLKKKQRPDGYESDGGYISEGPTKRKAKKGTSKDPVVFPSMETETEAKKRVKEEQKETDEMERKKKKSLISVVKASRKAGRKDAEQDETDGDGISSNSKKLKTKKSKSKLTTEDNDGGFETDGIASTPAKKSKTRFFKLSNKSSRPDLRVEPVPALPMPTPKEVVPLPIAERFATTFSPTSSSSQTRSETTSPTVGSLASSTAESLPVQTPLPPLSFHPFTSAPSETPETLPPSRSSPPASLQSPANRGSQASVETSSSNGIKYKSETVSAHSTSHGQGSGSHSTFASSQTHYPVGPIPANTTLPSPPNSGRTSDSSPSLALPTISFPNTRSPSPNPISPSKSSPPVAPLHIAKNLRMKPSLENINLSTRFDVSPSPISPISPSSMGPLRSTAPSPALVVGPPSPLPNRPADRLGIPRSPGAHLPSRSPSPYGHISPPLSALETPTPRPLQLTIPKAEHSGQTPSPRHSGLPSPNVLAYYDIPPPSPPPMGPLPTIPPHATNGNNQSPSTSGNPGHFPSAAVLRQRVIDRTPRQLPSEMGGFIQAQANIQRGKESPFPSRPLLPGGALPTTGLARQESRVNGTARYRDVYPQAVPASGSDLAPEFAPSTRFGEDDEDFQDVRRTRFRDDLSFINSINSETATDNGDEYAENLRDVLDRYDDGHHRSDDEDAEETGSLPYKRSTETTTSDEGSGLGYTTAPAPRPRIPRPSPIQSTEPEARETLYQFDDDGRTVGDRTSRWSGSIYSRASFMDEDASGKTRERLVDQVEKMLAMDAKRAAGGSSHHTGMGRGYIPPMPRLPEAYANSQATPARSWNRF